MVKNLHVRLDLLLSWHLNSGVPVGKLRFSPKTFQTTTAKVSSQLKLRNNSYTIRRSLRIWLHTVHTHSSWSQLVQTCCKHVWSLNLVSLQNSVFISQSGVHNDMASLKSNSHLYLEGLKDLPSSDIRFNRARRPCKSILQKWRVMLRGKQVPFLYKFKQYK